MSFAWLLTNALECGQTGGCLLYTSPELLTLKAELLEAQGDLAQAYRQFDQALDPELVESCVYQISAVKARCNYLIRAIKERSPEAAAAACLLYTSRCV